VGILQPTTLNGMGAVFFVTALLIFD
jgi:hypothetical protein